MSKNISILEGRITRVFSGLRKLFTRQSGSDDMIAWVPESDRQLTTKYITQNGVYRASDDGYYAYSSVTVSVPTDTGVTGEGDDGEQHYVAPDPETGELVDEVIPSSIVVETPPTNQYGIYKDGQAIGKGGMVVKAYLASGELYTGLPDGIVPNEQITLVPSSAAYDASTDTRDSWAADIDKSQLSHPDNITLPINPIFKSLSLSSDRDTDTHEVFGDGYIVPYADGNMVTLGFVARDSSAYVILTRSSDGATIRTNARRISGSQYYGKTVLPVWISPKGKVSAATEIIDISPNDVWADVAKVVYEGTLTKNPAGSHQTITAEWPRTGDGATLSDTFEILVAPPIYGGGEA